jgi:hypothetical protein
VGSAVRSARQGMAQRCADPRPTVEGTGGCLDVRGVRPLLASFLP